jgi:acyl-CoA reductase-like NAD-dependent aldehyde dehydrogenase
LGNNSAVIIEPDGDIETAVARSVVGAFTHSGQVCISLQRIFVHESVAGEFLQGLVSATKKLVVGHPTEVRTDVSSLISEKEAIRVSEWIAEAVAGGARLLTGGERRYSTITPTVLAGVSQEVRLSCKEVFGPVVAVYTYGDLDDAIESVNSTPYGLQAGIFTRDITRAFSAARRLRVGGVMINDIPGFRADHMPYGGVKESGLGREGPRYSVEEMTEMKLICWKI